MDNRQFKYHHKFVRKKICALKSLIVTNRSSLALKKKKPTKESKNEKDNTKSIFKIGCGLLRTTQITAIDVRGPQNLTEADIKA